MARKKKEEEPSITMSLTDFEDFIWMSYRYCIGRQTIASHCHAREVVKAIAKYDEKRQEHNANDILREVNDRLSFNDWSCRLYGNTEVSVINYCLNYILENNLWEHFYDLRFEIDRDFSKNQVVVTHSIHKNPNRYVHTLDDLLIWNDVANVFVKANHKIAVVENQGFVSEIEVYESWARVYGSKEDYPMYERVYKAVQQGKEGRLEWYVANECIKEIKDIE